MSANLPKDTWIRAIESATTPPGGGPGHSWRSLVTHSLVAVVSGTETDDDVSVRGENLDEFEIPVLGPLVEGGPHVLSHLLLTHLGSPIC